MARIEYLYTTNYIKVRLDETIVGTIKKVNKGWQYFPLRHKNGGDVYDTVKQVQESLEFED